MACPAQAVAHACGIARSKETHMRTLPTVIHARCCAAGRSGFRNWLAVSAAFLAVACSGDAPAPAEPAPPAAVTEPAPPAVVTETAPAERVAFVYEPLGPVAESYGRLSILLPPGNEGPGRTLSFGNGALIETTLLSGADITLPVGEVAMNEAIGVTQDALENGGTPHVYMLSVQSEETGDAESACGARPLGALLLRQPESEMDKSVTLVLLTALPTDPAVEICKRAVFLPG